MIGDPDLHRLRQIRDDMEWLHTELGEAEYKHSPYNHYRVQIKSMAGVVGSLIRNVETSVRT